MLWFYIRNVVGWLVPGSYSLHELRILPWLVTTGHLLGAVVVNRASISPYFVNWPQARRSLLPRAYVYVPFALTLTLTLWSVANKGYPPSQDGWFHAFFARVDERRTLLSAIQRRPSNLSIPQGSPALMRSQPPSRGSSVVKAHNLQHILWIVVGLHALTAMVALVARRQLAAAQSLPLLLLNTYPLHNLTPDAHWDAQRPATGSSPPDGHSHPVISGSRSGVLPSTGNRDSGCAEPARSGSQSGMCTILTPCVRGRPLHQLLPRSRRTGRAVPQSGVCPSWAHCAGRVPGSRLRPLLQQVNPEPQRSQLYGGIALRRKGGGGSGASFLLFACAGGRGWWLPSIPSASFIGRRQSPISQEGIWPGSFSH